MLVAAEVAIASHWLTFLATLLAGVLSIQVANAVLTTVVADQSEARNQSPEAVAKMHLRLMLLLLYRSHGNCRSPGVVHRQRIQGRLHST